MREIAAQSLIGLPVYSLNEGETLGRVKQLIIDPAERRLMALAVDKKGPRKNLRIIPSEKIHHLGTDAVTIIDRSAANRAANLPQLMKYLNRPNHLIGNRLISDDGQTLGKIEEYYLDSESRDICRLDINGTKGENQTRAAFNGRHIISIGPAAVMIDRTALDNPEILPTTSALARISAISEKISARITKALENDKKSRQKPQITANLCQSSENSETQNNNYSVKTTDNMHLQTASNNTETAHKTSNHNHSAATTEVDLQAEYICTNPTPIPEAAESPQNGHSEAIE